MVADVVFHLDTNPIAFIRRLDRFIFRLHRINRLGQVGCFAFNVDGITNVKRIYGNPDSRHADFAEIVLDFTYFFLFHI